MPEVATLYFRQPNASQLNDQINKLQEGIQSHPNDFAQNAFDLTVIQGFQRQLEILKQNPNIDINTRDGAWAMLQKVENDPKEKSLELIERTLSMENPFQCTHWGIPMPADSHCYKC